jgi:hypothetical protein
MADEQVRPPFLDQRYERLTGGPEQRARDYAMRRILHEHLGLTLEEFRALPWYVADSIEEGLIEEFSSEDEGGEGTQIELGSTDQLAAAGITMREVS